MTPKTRPFVGKSPKQTALAKDLLHNLLKTETLRIKFERLDGTTRRMTCTLRPAALPAKTKKQKTTVTKMFAPSRFVVWDVDKAAWRSVRYESILDAFVL